LQPGLLYHVEKPVVNTSGYCKLFQDETNH
jgi:hypothetical protein